MPKEDQKKPCKPSPTYTILLICFCMCVLVEGAFIVYLLNLNATNQHIISVANQQHTEELGAAYKQIEIITTEKAQLHNTQDCAKTARSITCALSNAPKNRIQAEQIILNKQRLIVSIKDATLGQPQATGSMLPTLNEYSHLLQIPPQSSDTLAIGDIIAFEQEKTLTVHRISQIGADEGGWYAITKGDHYSINDPNKIRFSSIKYVIIGILY